LSIDNILQANNVPQKRFEDKNIRYSWYLFRVIKSPNYSRYLPLL